MYEKSDDPGLTTENKHWAGTEILAEPKVFFAGRNNSVKIEAFCSFPASIFFGPKLGQAQSLSNKINKSNVFIAFPSQNSLVKKSVDILESLCQVSN